MVTNISAKADTNSGTNSSDDLLNAALLFNLPSLEGITWYFAAASQGKSETFHCLLKLISGNINETVSGDSLLDTSKYVLRDKAAAIAG